MRACVESCLSIAPPRGELAPGVRVLVWPRLGETVRGRLRRDCAEGFLLILEGRCITGAVQRVQLIATRPNYGGRRWWFVCAGCGARVGRLHLPRSRGAVHEFRCRSCHDLTYESVQTSRTKTRAFFLLYARNLSDSYRKTSYREARDRFRRDGPIKGAYLYEVRTLNFEPSHPAIYPDSESGALLRQ